MKTAERSRVTDLYRCERRTLIPSEDGPVMVCCTRHAGHTGPHNFLYVWTDPRD